MYLYFFGNIILGVGRGEAEIDEEGKGIQRENGKRRRETAWKTNPGWLISIKLRLIIFLKY